MRACIGLFAVGLSSAGLVFSQSTGKRPIGIDDVISYRRAQPMIPVWAPDGKKFIYEQRDGVYVYVAEERKGREWFRPADLEAASEAPMQAKEFGWQNRRVSSDSYQWFPNSKDLLASVKGDLFIIRSNGKFDQLTKTDIEEADPKLSPDGKQVLYRWKSNLYVLDIARKQARQLTSSGTPTLLNGQLDWVYPEELDLGTATWWSPDAKHIAYLQFDVSREFIYPQIDLIGERALSEPERYPQAGTANAQVKLGVVSSDGGETKWMGVGDTANSLVARVVWLPDGSQVAVERLTRVQNELDLLFCDPVTGAVRPVIQEQSKTWINFTDNLFFLKSKPEFLWTSERGGYRHIYRYSNGGEMLGQLTSGDWEVTGIAAIDEANGRVYFASSEVSPLEWQLYSVGFTGGERARITKEDGTHDIHANADGSYFVDSFSSLTKPGQTLLKNATGEELSILRPMDTKATDEFEILPTEIVKVTAPDGTILYGSLVKPPGFQPGTKYPVIVEVYGGPGAQSIRNRWMGIDWEQALAQRGYLVWQLDNRGSHGRGHAFETPIYHELGKQEVADQRVGVNYLIDRGLADSRRVGITGWSYGGYMTIHSLLLAPDVFKVGVAGAPVTDWHNYDTIYTERYMGLPEENPKGYTASSNVANASRLQGKLLIVHNIEDDNVLFQNTMQMVSALERAGKEYSMELFPQKTHGVTGPLRKPLYEAMTDFFDAHLKGAQ